MAMDSKQKTALLESAETVMGSWWTLVVGVCLGLAGAVIVLHYTARIFEASATLSMGSEVLPSGVVKETVVADPEVQLQEIRRAALGEANIKEVISATFGLGEDPTRIQNLESKIRSNTRVSRAGWSDSFELKFRDSNPERAAKVTNMLAEFFVKESRSFRKTRAADTAQTIKELAESRWADLQEKHREVADFLAEHPNRTEADRPMNLQLLAQARQDLEANRNEQETLSQQIDLFEAQRAQEQLSESFDVGTLPVSPSGTESSLRALESELRELRIKYSDSHPSVREKLTQIEEYRKQHPPTETLVETNEDAAGPDEDLLGATIWDASIKASRKKLAELTRAESRLKRDIREYQSRLEDTTEVQRRLGELNRNLASLEREYGDLTADAIDAETSERAEQSDRGKQFEVLTWAQTPSVPVEPQPMIIAAAGVGFGVLLFVGPLVARSLLIPVVRSEARLAGLVDLPILVTIPEIPTPESARQARSRRYRNSGFSVAAVLVLAAVLGLRYLQLL